MMEQREITKHLATGVDIQSDKFCEGVKKCVARRGRLHPLSGDYISLLEKSIWKVYYIEPVTQSAFIVRRDYRQQFYIDHTFDKAFAEMPRGLKLKVEWDAVAHFTEIDDYKNCNVTMTNFQINAIPDADAEVID